MDKDRVAFEAHFDQVAVGMKKRFLNSARHLTELGAINPNMVPTFLSGVEKITEPELIAILGVYNIVQEFTE